MIKECNTDKETFDPAGSRSVVDYSSKSEVTSCIEVNFSIVGTNEWVFYKKYKENHGG